jgi:hypothetical protein
VVSDFSATSVQKNIFFPGRQEPLSQQNGCNLTRRAEIGADEKQGSIQFLGIVIVIRGY